MCYVRFVQIPVLQREESLILLTLVRGDPRHKRDDELRTRVPDHGNVTHRGDQREHDNQFPGFTDVLRS